MNWFLDMCIIIFYAEDSQEIKSVKSKEFIKNKEDSKFFLCFYITKENMPKWIQRQKAIINLIRMNIKNPSLEIEKLEDYNLLFKQDIIKLKKLLGGSSQFKNKQEYYNIIKRNHIVLIQRINYFLAKLIDKEVIEKVDPELRSTLFTFLQNYSDAVTLASAIQCHNKEEEITILTGDKKDWTKDNIQWTFDSKLQLAKTYQKIPEIKYIQNL